VLRSQGWSVNLCMVWYVLTITQPVACLARPAQRMPRGSCSGFGMMYQSCLHWIRACHPAWCQLMWISPGRWFLPGR